MNSHATRNIVKTIFFDFTILYFIHSIGMVGYMASYINKNFDFFFFGSPFSVRTTIRLLAVFSPTSLSAATVSSVDLRYAVTPSILLFKNDLYKAYSLVVLLLGSVFLTLPRL